MTLSNQSRKLLSTERFDVEEVTRTLADGREKTRAVVRHPGAVAIVPMIDDEHVCLIANYRVAVDQVLWEIPAGTLERAESPLDTARRELIEETGYRAEVIEPIASFYLSPGIMDERMHVFVARGLTAGEPERELGEEMENRIVPYDEALAMIFDGRIHDAKTIAGLLIYDRVRRTYS